MSQIAVGITHVVAITDSESLAIFGEDQDKHFPNYKVAKDEPLHGELKLIWNDAVYKPKMVATRGPITAVVASAQRPIGGGKIDDIRKVLLEIKKVYIARKARSYFKLFDDITKEIKGTDMKGRSSIAGGQREKSGALGESKLMSSEIKPGTNEEDKKEEKKKETKKEAEEPVDGATPLQEKELFNKKLQELADRWEDEKNDEEYIEHMILQRILKEFFKLESREVDMFLFEMSKLSLSKTQSKISIRVIKDCINDSRLDDGRLFIFKGSSNNYFTLKTLEISPPSEKNISLLYNPDSYEPIEAVACGDCHMLILTKGGAVYSCGDSAQGALGLGHITVSVEIPMRVDIKKHKGSRIVKMIAAGREHSMCLSTNNEVFTWGNGQKGKLGHGTEEDEKFPREISTLHQYTPIFITAGDSHSACISASGKLFTWGDGQYGKLGHGSTKPELLPQRVSQLADIEIVTVSCGAFHTLAVDKSGKAWEFGQTKVGNTGSVEAETTNVPSPVQGFDNAISVFAGLWNSYGIKRDNKVYSWGSPEKRMLGREDHKSPMMPKPIDWLKITPVGDLKVEGQKEASFSSKVANVVCSFSNTFAITDAGEVFVLGSNAHGQAGVAPDKKKTRFKIPKKIPIFSPENNNQVKMLACGFGHVLALTITRKLFAWGANSCGQLGNGRREQVNEPAVVEMFKETVVEFCACGDEYSAVINETGELFTFGSHAKGRLGLGPVDEEGHQLIPLKIEVEGFPHIKSICCGANHVLAIPDYDSEDDSADKGLWSWGLSTRGQLGHGNKETLYSPKLIQKVMTERFRKVVCGLEHSMGLTDQGTLYYWGAHEYLLRSDYGNTKDKDEPIIMQASTTEKIIDIAACHHYNLAIALGSDVIYWGEFFKENTESKGKGGSKSIVIESKLGIKAKQIACGPNHAAAIKFNDCMYTWGNDSDGALGYRAPKGKPVTNPEMVWSLKKAIEKNSKAAPEVARPEADAKGGAPEQPAKPGEEEKDDADKKEEQKVPGEKAKKSKKSQMKHVVELPEATKIIPLQKALKDSAEIAQDCLISKQKSLSKALEKVLSRFKEISNKTVASKTHMQDFVINLVSRLENGPFQSKRKLYLISKKNKAIKDNKKYLKEIFTAYFLHPCYMNHFIRNNIGDQVFLGSFVNALYANSADKKYTRVLLMNLGILVFNSEIKKNNKPELVSRKDYSAAPSLFTKIFDLIFINEVKCMNYASGLAALCFNDMYQTVTQRFQEEAPTCYKEMSGKNVQESNKKTIESKLKTRCDSVKHIVEKIRQRLIEGIEPDKQAGAMFIVDHTCNMPKTIKTLLWQCREDIKTIYNTKGDQKENGEVIAATILLPLVIKHACHILHKSSLLLLYASSDKNKKDIIVEEATKHENNAQVIASVLMCYVTGTKSFSEISNFRMVQEFNKEMKNAEDRLVEILNKLIGTVSKEPFIKSYIKNSCSFENTVVAISGDQIKTLTGLLNKHAADIALIRPIDNDPIYKNIKLIKLGYIEAMRPNPKPINFRINTSPLQQDQSLLICKKCNSFVTQSTSSPYCTKFIEEIPRLDSLSDVFLYEGILIQADEILPADALDNPIGKIGDQANKRANFELMEMVDNLMSNLKKTNKDKDKDREFENIRSIAIKDFNERVKLRGLLRKKKAIVKRLGLIIDSSLAKFRKKEEEMFPKIASNLQYGLANKELEVPAAAAQGLSQVREAINYINSLEISTELFEHLLSKEKEGLTPFIKRPVSTLMSQDVIRSIFIPNSEAIIGKCSLVMCYTTNDYLEIHLVYQDFKDSLCGTIQGEIEARLFTYKFTTEDAYKMYKLAHKYDPDLERTLTIEKSEQNAIVFGLEGLMKYYGEMKRQAIAYTHRTKVDVPKEEEENSDEEGGN